MFTPTVYRKNLFDTLFDFPTVVPFGSGSANLMRSDIRENDQGYTIDIDMPGVKKEDIKLQLKDSLLSVSAEVNQNSDNADENGRYLRRERFTGSYTRSFTVSEDITDEDITARFSEGVLSLFIPKKPQVVITDEPKYIPIAD